MTNQPLPLQRSAYHDPFSNQLIVGNASTQQNALDMEQYYQPLERFHASSLHGWGVAAGLRVTATLNAAGVTVRPGVALDNRGLHILLVSGGQVDVRMNASDTPHLTPVTDNGGVVPTTGLTGDRYLVLQFSETFDGSSDPARYTHTPWLHFLDATQPVASDGSLIVLALITLGTGTSAGLVSTLPQDLRQRVNGHLEYEYTASTHGPAVVTGLGITATLNAPGITVQTGLALDSKGQYIPLLSGGQAETSPTADAPALASSLIPVSDEGVPLPTTGLTGDQYLTIQFWETLITETTTFPETLESVAPEHFAYTPWLRFTSLADFVNDGSRVILATISFGTGATAGQVTNWTSDQRPATSLSVGGISLVRSSTDGQFGAGDLFPLTNGLAFSVPHEGDEIQLIGSKVLLNAEQVVTRSIIGTEKVLINSLTGNITSETLTATGLTVGTISVASSGSGTVTGFARSLLNATGLELSVPSTSDEIHLKSSTGVRIAKIVLGAAKVAVWNTNGNDGVVLDGDAGVTSPSLTTKTLSLTNPITGTSGGIINSLASGLALTVPDASGEIHLSTSAGTNAARISLAANAVTVTGNFSVTGQKQFVQDHPTDPTKQVAYVSLEGGEAGTYVRGMGTLINGKAVIELPEHFRLVTNPQGLTIQLTPRGAWLQLYTVELDTSQVVVREAQDKNGEFDYFIQGIRAGHENHQPIQEKVF